MDLNALLNPTQNLSQGFFGSQPAPISPTSAPAPWLNAGAQQTAQGQGMDWGKIGRALAGGLLGGVAGGIGQAPAPIPHPSMAPSAGIMGGHIGNIGLPQATALPQIASILAGYRRHLGG